RGVRAVLPPAPRLPFRGHRRRGRGRRHAGRVRGGARAVLGVLVRPGGRGERVAVLHEPDVRGGPGAGRGRRRAAHARLALAVGRAVRARRPGDPAGARAARARHARGRRTAGVTDVLVAPLGVGGARPPRRGRHRGGEALRGVGGGHGGDGGGVRRRAAPVRPPPRRGAGAQVDPAAAGRGRHLRLVHGAAHRPAVGRPQVVAGGAAVTHDELVAYCLGKPGAVEDEPWDGDVVAKVGGKIFAFLGGGGLGVKCGATAEEAAELRHRYPEHVTVMPYIGRHG